ncbi:5-oxoprolinase subunit B family protein [Vannielia litorea]|uniref:5-oxoprolinase subunit B family protein n=1 Tax=Vannielia litorea TaxID=1217970 RepID=UPI001C9717E2|nr:carboxyltransferase domain-containing protein [Vannielia litorea]MBY6048955.1 allophanate hydrolase subunit 1 [Vannielia litorea]MBY6076369.1 allophanate hydrolase subunit 1 [Vannielia litorea]
MDAAEITPEILPLGQDGVLVRFARAVSPEASAAVARFAAEAEGLAGEVAPALASVLLRFDPAQVDRAELVARIEELLDEREWRGLKDPTPARRWRVPVALDGPQLGEAAELAGLSEAEACEEFLTTELRVRAIGFAPGMPYLGFLPEHWNIPRQTDLTPKVPAGALVVAVRQLVLFPTESVTGWRMVGRCAFRPFRRGAKEPFPLAPGDALRFERVEATELERLEAEPLGGAVCEEIA